MNFPLTDAFNVFHIFGFIVYLLPGNFNISLLISSLAYSSFSE